MSGRIGTVRTRLGSVSTLGGLGVAVRQSRRGSRLTGRGTADVPEPLRVASLRSTGFSSRTTTCSFWPRSPKRS